jgi:hypothetical protein
MEEQVIDTPKDRQAQPPSSAGTPALSLNAPSGCLPPTAAPMVPTGLSRYG